MSSVEIELKGFRELADKLTGLADDARGQIALNAVEGGGAVIQANAQMNALSVFSDRQRGQLRNSIRVESRGTGEGAEAEIGPHVIYGRIQEFGGTIHARGNGYLHFEIDGQWVKTKKVVLPARPYLAPAANDHLDEILAAMAEEVERGLQ